MCMTHTALPALFAYAREEFAEHMLCMKKDWGSIAEQGH